MLLLLALSGCGSSSEPESGIVGTVEWVSCGVPVTFDGSCVSGPAPAKLRILRDGELLQVVQVGEDGRFRIPLEPGRYELDPEEEGMAGWHFDDGVLPLRVEASRFERLEIAYSGGPICTDPERRASAATERWAGGRWYP